MEEKEYKFPVRAALNLTEKWREHIQKLSQILLQDMCDRQHLGVKSET
jgi:hypothetical protein